MSENTKISEREAYDYARSHQGFDGSYEDWLALAADEREEYERGAAGIPTE